MLTALRIWLKHASLITAILAAAPCQGFVVGAAKRAWRRKRAHRLLPLASVAFVICYCAILVWRPFEVDAQVTARNLLLLGWLVTANLSPMTLSFIAREAFQRELTIRRRILGSGHDHEHVQRALERRDRRQRHKPRSPELVCMEINPVFYVTWPPALVIAIISIMLMPFWFGWFVGLVCVIVFVSGLFNLLTPLRMMRHGRVTLPESCVWCSYPFDTGRPASTGSIPLCPECGAASMEALFVRPAN